MNISAPTRLLKIIALLCLGGILIAAKSLYLHTGQRYGLQLEPSFCNINDQLNCDAVNASAFSMIFGVPVAALGIFYYLLMLYGALLGLSKELVPQRVLAGVLAVAALFGLIFSAYLFVVSRFIIKAFCLLCLGLDVINLLLFYCTWKLWPGGDSGGRLTVGLRSILAYPAVLFKGPASKAGVAWVTLMVGALSGFVVTAAPDFMVKYLSSSAKESANNMAGEVVSNWKAQQLVKFEVHDGGALIRDYAHGAPDAPVKVVEFSDYECPACRSFQPAVEDTLHKYGDKIYYVTKNFPLDKSCNPTMSSEMHHHACTAVVFARCAGEQGKFWEAHNALFSLPELERTKSQKDVAESLDKLGMALELDLPGLHECIMSGRYKEKIAADAKEGQKFGVDRTPSVWINGKRLDVTSELAMTSVIDNILKNRS